MPKTAETIHPKDLSHGDRVTIRDLHGSELTGLVRRTEADNKLQVELSIKAFGKEIKVATWNAGRGRTGNGLWKTHFPIVHRELTLW